MEFFEKILLREKNFSTLKEKTRTEKEKKLKELDNYMKKNEKVFQGFISFSTEYRKTFLDVRSDVEGYEEFLNREKNLKKIENKIKVKKEKVKILECLREFIQSLRFLEQNDLSVGQKYRKKIPFLEITEKIRNIEKEKEFFQSQLTKPYPDQIEKLLKKYSIFQKTMLKTLKKNNYFFRISHDKKYKEGDRILIQFLINVESSSDIDEFLKFLTGIDFVRENFLIFFEEKIFFFCIKENFYGSKIFQKPNMYEVYPGDTSSNDGVFNVFKFLQNFFQIFKIGKISDRVMKKITNMLFFIESVPSKEDIEKLNKIKISEFQKIEDLKLDSEFLKVFLGKIEEFKVEKNYELVLSDTRGELISSKTEKTIVSENENFGSLGNGFEEEEINSEFLILDSVFKIHEICRKIYKENKSVQIREKYLKIFLNLTKIIIIDKSRYCYRVDEVILLYNSLKFLEMKLNFFKEMKYVVLYEKSFREKSEMILKNFLNIKKKGLEILVEKITINEKDDNYYNNVEIVNELENLMTELSEVFGKRKFVFIGKREKILNFFYKKFFESFLGVIINIDDISIKECKNIEYVMTYVLHKFSKKLKENENIFHKFSSVKNMMSYKLVNIPRRFKEKDGINGLSKMEVEKLVKALFIDSKKRKKAIAELWE